MPANVHATYNGRQAKCAPGDIYRGNLLVHHTYMARVGTRFKQPRWRKTYIRAWRKSRGLTLMQLAERVGTTHATLSRIERSRQPYSQALLEAISVALDTDPASLLIRDPADPAGIWSIWDQAKPGERQMIVDIAKTVIKTGT